MSISERLSRWAQLLAEYNWDGGSSLPGGIAGKADANSLRAGTDNEKALTAKSAYDAIAEVALTYAATVTVSFSAGTDFAITLTGGVTFAVSNTSNVVGKRGRIRIKQNGTGGHAAIWPPEFKWPGGEAGQLSADPNKEDFLDYEIVAANRIRVALTQDVPA